MDSSTGAADEAVILPDESMSKALSTIESMPDNRVRSIVEWTPHDTYVTDAPEIDWVWGVALAKAAEILVADFDDMAYTWRTAEHRDAAREAYLATIASALNGGGQASMLAVMREIVERIHTLEGCYTLPNRRGLFQRALADWWHDASMPDIWNMRQLEEVASNCHEVWLLDAVRRHDRSLYVELLEDTHDPVVAKHILLTPDVVEDGDEILNLLAVAPLVRSGITPIDPLGEWNHRIAAPSLLEVTIEHARRLAGLVLHNQLTTSPAPEDIARFTHDLEGFFDRTAAVVMGRNDGIALAAEWMLHITREVSHTSWDGTLVPERIALHTVGRHLVTQGMDEEALQRNLIELRHATLGVDALLALIVLSYERDQSVIANLPEMDREPVVATRNTLLSNIFADLLHRGDRDLSYHRNASPPSWSHAYTGLLFARTVDPRQDWQATWLRLAEQRRRIYYLRYGQDGPMDEPSLYVLYAGIAGVQWLLTVQDEGSVETAAHLWDCMYEASLAVTLRLGTYHKRWPSADEWRRATLMLVVLLPHVTRHASDRLWNIDRVDTLLRDLGGDDELVVQSLSLLRRNGMSNTEIRGAARQAGIDLGAIVARYAEISGDQRFVSMRHRHPNPLDDCRILLDESIH